MTLISTCVTYVLLKDRKGATDEYNTLKKLTLAEPKTSPAFLE